MDIREPALASPEYTDLMDRHGLEMLKETGDWSLVDGDLALTKDGDIMVGDVAYNALYRLVEHWRHNPPHVEHLHALSGHMLVRYREALARLDIAGEEERARIAATGRIVQSPEFLEGWHAHWGEEGAAVFGNQTYAGCVVLLASSALLRFKDDLDVPDAEWRSSGTLFGGRSVGQIVVAAANGFRHEDEWSKARVATPQQKRSQDVLDDVLGPCNVGADAPPPGRCPEVLDLLARGQGLEGLTGTVLGFAHEVAQQRKAVLTRAAPLS